MDQPVEDEGKTLFIDGSYLHRQRRLWSLERRMGSSEMAHWRQLAGGGANLVLRLIVNLFKTAQKIPVDSLIKMP